VADGSADDATAGRRPPLAPALFTEELKSKRFTNDSDSHAVAHLYERTVTRVLGATKLIMLEYVPVRAGNGSRLAAALALCQSIEALSWFRVEMPEEEGQAMLQAVPTTLKHLRLDDNQLSGSIPEALGACVALQTLLLSDNELSGPIPEALGACAALQELYLHGNQLSGQIPEALGTCAALQVLSVHGNQLSGPIPEALGACVALQVLSLHGNQLNGPIPEALGACVALQELSLHGNQLSGSIPGTLTRIVD